MRRVTGLAVCAVMLASVLGLSPAGAESLSMVSYHIPLLVESESTGLFVEVCLEAARRSGAQARLTILPPKRAMAEFSQGRHQAICPALKPALGEKAVVTGETINVKEVHAFVRTGDRVPLDVAELRGLRVGLTLGFSYPEELLRDKEIVLDWVPDDETNMRKLAAGRIDVSLADGKSGVRALEELGLHGVIYRPQAPIGRIPAYIAFQDDPAGRALAARFTKALADMKADGTYQRIMAPLR